MSLIIPSSIGWSITGLSIGLSGAGLMLQLISNMSSSITNVKVLMTNIKSYTKTKYNKNILVKLDLDRKIEIIESLINNIDLTSEHIDTLDLAINSVIECVNNIKNMLILITERISYNKSLWIMKSLRAYNIDKYILELENLDSVLDKRVELLKSIIELNNTPVCKNNKHDRKNDIIELD